jgi:AbrB family looped-hinge helix DNA binding protein
MIKQIVQPMARGQITIPIKIRDKLGIDENSWLWVKLQKNKIIIEPVEENTGAKTQYFLEDAANNKNVYWSKSDTNKLEKIDEKSKERLKGQNK